MTTFADDFNRTSNPLASPWSTTDIAGSTARLRCTSATGQCFASQTGYCHQYVNGSTFTIDEEIWLQIPVLGNTGTNEICALYGRLNGAGATSVTGYEMSVLGNGTLTLFRVESWATQTQLVALSHALAAGNWVKFRIVGTNPVVLEAYWSADGVTWTYVGGYNDSAVNRNQAGSKVGLEIQGTAPRIDSFNAADYVAAGVSATDKFFDFI